MSNIETSSKSDDLYTIKFDHRPKYLYALISGKEDSLEVARKYWTDLLDECRRHNFDKLLVEENLDRSLSMKEMYDFAVEYTGMGFQDILVAFVDRRPEHHQLNRFAETVAINRGNRIRVFDTVPDAKHWLLIN